MKSATLVVMAAGMGSRFGGLKQLEPIGKNGEVIIDFSVYDAMKAGFDKVVFIIKKEIEADFKRIVGSRVENKIKVDYVYQEAPSNRKKPYGTAQAVMLCKDVVNTPFAVINADDYYGKEAYVKIYEHLTTSPEFAMVGYYLRNTVTENGTVTRGVCKIEDGYLVEVIEKMDIAKENEYPTDTIVSMNMWGLHPWIFSEFEAGFKKFVETTPNIEKDEFYLPMAMDTFIKAGKIKVKALSSSDKWYGVTYKEDKEAVVNALTKMVNEGMYEGM